jgi:hypothetical protein
MTSGRDACLFCRMTKNRGAYINAQFLESLVKTRNLRRLALNPSFRCMEQ